MTTKIEMPSILEAAVEDALVELERAFVLLELLARAPSDKSAADLSPGVWAVADLLGRVRSNLDRATLDDSPSASAGQGGR